MLHAVEGSPGEQPGDRRLSEAYTPGSHKRSLAKAVSWRITGSLDTLVLSFLTLTFVGPLVGLDSAGPAANAVTASHIAITELLTKIVLFYLHERAWERVGWNLRDAGDGTHRDRHGRTLAKTASWRVLASVDTTLLALVFTGSLGTALSIGGSEIVTKLGLYYLHERAWAQITWGAAKSG